MPENTISEVKTSSSAPDTQPSKGGATFMDVEENGAEEGEVSPPPPADRCGMLRQKTSDIMEVWCETGSGTASGRIRNFWPDPYSSPDSNPDPKLNLKKNSKKEPYFQAEIR